MTASIFGRAWVVWMVALLANAVSVRCITSREYDSMLDTLRVRGYTLFSNAIVTSDLQIELLSYGNSSHAFTFFAPTDSSLFALDMTQTASSYTDTLRFHVVPRRLSLAQLRLLPDGYRLPTLLPQRHLQLTRRHPSALAVTIAGVEVAVPGLFYGRDVAVHGLAGILTHRSNNSPSPSPVVPPIRSADPRFFSPRSSPYSPENQPVLGPISHSVPKFVTFNATTRPGSPPPAEAPAPGSMALTREAPAASPVNEKVDAPEREPDWTVQPPANLAYSPVASPPGYPYSSISLPPEVYSDAAGPAPEALAGRRKCVDGDVGLEESTMGENVGQMQCHAA